MFCGAAAEDGRFSDEAVVARWREAGVEKEEEMSIVKKEIVKKDTLMEKKEEMNDMTILQYCSPLSETKDFDSFPYDIYKPSNTNA